MFLQALSKKRSQEERESLVDELFHRFEIGLIRDGRGIPEDMVEAYIVVQKIAE